jgi:hypothetical protein
MLVAYAILPQDRAKPHQKMEALMLRHITNIYRALLFLGLLAGWWVFQFRPGCGEQHILC